MSYYDHAVSMHLKLGRWDAEGTSNDKRLPVIHRRGRSQRNVTLATMMVALVVGLLVLGFGRTSA